MTRLALYLVCATGLAVIGARMFNSTTQAHAQINRDFDRAEREWCDDSAKHRPAVPPVIKEPAEEGDDKSRIVKTLLKIIDELDGEFDGDGEHNSKDYRNLLRRVLRQADPELARSLGPHSLRLIAEANCKPKKIAIYLHCDRDDRVGEPDPYHANRRDGAHNIPHDAPFENPECKEVRPLRVGTIDNPIPPKNDPHAKTDDQQPPQPAKKPNPTDPSGEDPFNNM